MDISRIADVRLSLHRADSSNNTQRLPFSTWSSLSLQRPPAYAGKAAGDQVRMANFKNLIEFARNLVKDNKTVPDYTRAEHLAEHLADSLHAQADLEDILYDTFLLPENTVLELICDLGIKERGALAEMKWTLDANLARANRTPPCVFQSAELKAERRQWAMSTLTAAGRIDGDRLDKMHREMKAFVDNCAKDAYLMQYLDVADVRELGKDIRDKIFKRLEVNLNDAIGGKCRILGFRKIDAVAETSSLRDRSDSEIRVSQYVKLGMKDLITTIGHEGFHASQFKEIGAEVTFWGKGITPDQLLKPGNAKSYEKVMMAIATQRPLEEGSERDYRQWREVEREGYAAGMLCLLYMAHHDKFNPDRKGFPATLVFQSGLHRLREEDPVAIVRQAVERKIGFTMREFADAAKGQYSDVHAPGTAGPALSINERIWMNLRDMSLHIGEEIQGMPQSQVRGQILDAVLGIAQE